VLCKFICLLTLLYFPPGPQLPSQPQSITTLSCYQFILWVTEAQVWTTCPGLLHSGARPGIEPIISHSQIRRHTMPPAMQFTKSAVESILFILVNTLYVY